MKHRQLSRILSLKQTPNKIYIIAGEASGDQIGAKLMWALKERDASYEFYGIGGDNMQAAGLKSDFPMQELSIMGLAEIIPHIRRIVKRIKQTVSHIIAVQPVILITIDSSGFTHRVIKRVKKQIKRLNLPYIPSVHYAAPPVWAWRPWRAKSVAKFLDHLLCLYPFEPPYFTKHGLKTTFVGHPITENHITIDNQTDNKEKKILILPGSRTSEIKLLLPTFLEVAQKIYSHQKCQFLLPTLPHLIDNVKAIIPKGLPVQVTTDFIEKDKMFKKANSAIAASGTVSLELAQYQIPHVIAYKASTITAFLLKILVKTRFVALPNILAHKYIVPELLQGHCRTENIHEAFQGIDTNSQRKALKEVFETLYCKQNDLTPSQYAAQIIENLINEQSCTST